MIFSLLALLVAAGAAVWLLLRMARGDAPGGAGRNDVIFKGVAFLALIAVMLAAKWWPLAFMTMLAAGAVMGIELWRANEIRQDEAMRPPAAPLKAAMKKEEAASVLGVAVGASADEIRSAHKKLIAQLHPDKGGTDYLAAQINDARTILMKEAALEEETKTKEDQPANGDPPPNPNSDS